MAKRNPQAPRGEEPEAPSIIRGAVPSTAFSANWAAVLLFVAINSFLFTAVFEWTPYGAIVGWAGLPLPLIDKAAIFWLLFSKSVLILCPVLLVVWILMRWRFSKTAAAALVIVWTLISYWMAADITLMAFSGNHASTYLPYLYDMAMTADKKYGDWTGDGVTFIVMRLPLLVGCWGLVSWILLSRGTTRLFKQRPALSRSLSWPRATAVFAAVTLAVFPALTLVSEPSILRRLETTLPLYMSVFEKAVIAQRDALAAVVKPDSAADKVFIYEIHPLSGAGQTGQGGVSLVNRGREDVDLTGWALVDPEGNELSLEGKIPAGRGLIFDAPEGALDLHGQSRVMLRDAEGWPRHLMAESGAQRVPDRLSLDRALAQSKEFLLDAAGNGQRLKELLEKDGPATAPADSTAKVDSDLRPNVIMIVLESFRDSAVSQDLMKRLDSFSRKGLRLHKHYSGSNCTHMGLFSLFYGRIPNFYGPILDKRVPPQLCESLKLSGYKRTFLSSGAHDGFRRTEDFINGRSFDKVIVDPRGEREGFSEWPEADRRILGHAGEILREARGVPQFVVSFLWSTHCPYVYPPAFDTHRPSGAEEDLAAWTGFPQQTLLNRYRNAALFLEEELMKFIESVDLTRNVIIITGDHGESFGEDGFHSHTGPISEVQTRVPFIMVGAGLRPREILTATSHVDVTPTLLSCLAGHRVPVRNCHGRDLATDPKPLDEAMITPLMWPELTKLALIKGNSRIVYNLETRAGAVKSLRFSSFLDQSGMYELRVSSLQARPRPAFVAQGRPLSVTSTSDGHSETPVP